MTDLSRLPSGSSPSPPIDCLMMFHCAVAAMTRERARGRSSAFVKGFVSAEVRPGAQSEIGSSALGNTRRPKLSSLGVCFTRT